MSVPIYCRKVLPPSSGWLILDHVATEVIKNLMTKELHTFVRSETCVLHSADTGVTSSSDLQMLSNPVN